MVIHGASTVSFDPPIDEAFRTNVAGVVTCTRRCTRLAPTRTSSTSPRPTSPASARASCRRPGSTTPSTGAPRWPRPSPPAPTSSATRGGPRCCASRCPGRRASTARPDAQSVVAAAEEARQEWVTDRLVDYGRSRAQSLGWPDVHLHQGPGRARRRGAVGRAAAVHRPPGDRGELAAPPVPRLDRRLQDGRPADHRVRPGRPAGVPRPARRRCSRSPPVDLVVNATIAVAATHAQRGETGYFHIGSGSRNPLSSAACTERPRLLPAAPDAGRRARPHPGAGERRFPGSRQVEQDAEQRRARRLGGRAGRCCACPRSAKTRDWMTAGHPAEQPRLPAPLLRPVPGSTPRPRSSTTTAARTRCTGPVPPSGSRSTAFDPSIIDWGYYLQEVHSPTASPEP